MKKHVLENKEHRMSKKKIILIIVVILIIAIMLFLLPAVINGIQEGFETSIEVRDEYQQISESVTYDVTAGTDSKNTSESEPENVSEDMLNWYDTMEEAMEDVSLIEDSSFYTEGTTSDISRKIAELKNGDTICIIYANGGISVCNAKMYMRDGKYSQPYSIYYGVANFDDYTSSLHYYLNDSVAQSILDAYALGQSGGGDIYNEDGNEVYYGAGKSEEEVESLIIDGNSVDAVVPYDANGVMYYYWYYDKTDLADELKAIDPSGYTLEEVENALDIEYTPATDETEETDE